MKILQLCKKFPYPPKDGESIAVMNLSKAIHQLGNEVTLLAMNTSKHYFSLKQPLPILEQYQSIHTVKVDNKLKFIDAFFNLFSKDSYHISRFISADFEEALSRLLVQNEFDVVQLETLYLAPYIPVIRKHSDATIAMRAHNVEHEIWLRIFRNTRFPLKKWYLKHLTEKLRNFERSQLNKYDILVAITERDSETFRQMGYCNSSIVTPIGIDCTDYRPKSEDRTSGLSVSFIGSLDWMPNQEGLMWFLDNVWVYITDRFPDLNLHIAGRNTPAWLKKFNYNNIRIEGEVADAKEFINHHPLMIVPLLSGSGMRAKILEAMALGKVVLTTRIGLEGIPAEEKKHILIADTLDEFSAAFDYCYSNPEKMVEIGMNARLFVEEHYENIEIAKRLLEAYWRISALAE